MCLGLHNAPKAKPFSNWYFFQWWYKTSHMPSLKYQSQINIVTNPVNCPHNIQHNLLKKLAKMG